MTWDELKSKLEGGIETQTFEVKGACDWNVKSLAKDILAMSNVQDGGTIIIGVQDGTFALQGVTQAQKDSYRIDTMKSQMMNYADPHVNFKVEIIPDTDGKEYVAITVFPFEEVPVICKSGAGGGVNVGVLYYRNKNGTVQSAPISNAYDMRDVITTATVKMMQKLKKVGLTVEGTQSVEKALNDELEGL